MQSHVRSCQWLQEHSRQRTAALKELEGKVGSRMKAGYDSHDKWTKSKVSGEAESCHREESQPQSTEEGKGGL
jgi:hypothetical protein